MEERTEEEGPGLVAMIQNQRTVPNTILLYGLIIMTSQIITTKHLPSVTKTYPEFHTFDREHENIKVK